MEAYAQVLLIAIPFFIGLIIIEALYSYRVGKLSFKSMDTISSLNSGTTNTLKSVLELSVVIISYGWLVEKVAIMDIKLNWMVWVLSFFAIDFAGYWSHRLNHSVNIFWNRHIVHHSSEEFNLACALRQPISNIISFGFIFLLPAALLGLPANVIGTLAPIHLFLQFWYHTKHIPKLGFLEYFMVTPSQHRVHHAINDIYIDKNLSPIFCIWDRMFGTFQEELKEEPCVYGVKRAVSTWNPIKINWIHAWQIIKDSWRTKRWLDKIKVWFMPTGWRPEDVKVKYPVEYTINPYEQIKYDPKSSPGIHYWSWFQYVLSTLLLTHLLIHISKIGFPMLFVYGAFLFIMIYSFSSLMDMEKEAVWIEILKSIFGFSIIYYTGGWFHLEEILPYAQYLLAAYFLISIATVVYFSKQEIYKKSIVSF